MKPTRHRNIPVFIPHLGCPCHCVFCNQKAISGNRTFQKEDGIRIFDEAAETISAGLETIAFLPPEEQKIRAENTEIAFFGGSFTAIDRSLMQDLLALAREKKRQFGLGGIRISTRPDCVEDDILDLLEEYEVTHIELGIQSLCNQVLRECERNHTADQSLDAIRRILARKTFTLTAQMMTGLPASTPEKDYNTALRLCELGVHSVRIYPTVVLEHTVLAQRMQEGRYLPPTLDQSSELAAALLRLFSQKGIRVLRLGLCAEDGLSGNILSPYNPSFGEMALGKLFGATLKKLLQKADPSFLFESEGIFYVPPERASAAAGYRGENRRFIESKTALRRFYIRTCPALRGYDAVLALRKDQQTLLLRTDTMSQNQDRTQEKPLCV